MFFKVDYIYNAFYLPSKTLPLVSYFLIPDRIYINCTTLQVFNRRLIYTTLTLTIPAAATQVFEVLKLCLYCMKHLYGKGRRDQG